MFFRSDQVVLELGKDVVVKNQNENPTISSLLNFNLPTLLERKKQIIKQKQEISLKLLALKQENFDLHNKIYYASRDLSTKLLIFRRRDKDKHKELMQLKDALEKVVQQAELLEAQMMFLNREQSNIEALIRSLRINTYRI